MSDSSDPTPSKSPLVSVIIPVYNGERFLAEAIQSLKRQNYQLLEIIVIDDGSTDRTAEIAAQFHSEIRYAYQSNQGPAAARNHGIKLAQGDVIAFLDADDLWADQVLPDLIDYLSTHPDIEIVQGLIQKTQLTISENCEPALLFQPISQPYQFVNLGSAVYRKSVFDRVGLFDPALRYNEDNDWFMRAWEHNITKVVLPKVMLFYRRHDHNMTLKKPDLLYFGWLKLFKRHIDRLRLQEIATPLVSWTEYSGQTSDVEKILE